MHLCFIVVIDAVLLSRNDVMRNRSFTFQRRMRNQRNTPVPGIRIPMRTVQRRFMREGGCCILCKVMTMQYSTGRRIPIVNIFIVNLESRLRNDKGYHYDYLIVMVYNII